MDKEIKIYLSGSIKKGTGDSTKSYYWTSADEDYLRQDIDSDYNVILLNPANAEVKRNDYYANFGCDLMLVTESDFLIADLRERRGIGIGSEMTVAKCHRIPVIAFCPKETHYRRSILENVCGEDLRDWIHPFVFGWSDVVVENLQEAVEWINDFLRAPKQVKDISIVQDSIDYYKRTNPKYQ